jgi:hypothetical protein
VKEKTRLAQIEQAKLDRLDALNKARLDREAASNREAKSEVAWANKRSEDNCRYKASQERIAVAQAAMMTVLAKLAGGS